MPIFEDIGFGGGVNVHLRQSLCHFKSCGINGYLVISLSRLREYSSDSENYPRGRRGGFAKALGGATRARVRLPHSPPILFGENP